MADEMEWLRNHMQSYMADWTSSDPSEKVVRLRISRGSTSEHTQRALSLISDAAQLISDMEERAIALQEHGPRRLKKPSYRLRRRSVLSSLENEPLPANEWRQLSRDHFDLKTIRRFRVYITSAGCGHIRLVDRI